MNVDKVLDTYNECREILEENKYRLSKEDYIYFKQELIDTLYCIHIKHKRLSVKQ